MCKRKLFLVALMVCVLVTGIAPAAQADMGGPAKRIRFQAGATSGAVSGQLAARAAGQCRTDHAGRLVVKRAGPLSALGR
jgi:hypothetical protein